MLVDLVETVFHFTHSPTDRSFFCGRGGSYAVHARMMLINLSTYEMMMVGDFECRVRRVRGVSFIFFALLTFGTNFLPVRTSPRGGDGKRGEME